MKIFNNNNGGYFYIQIFIKLENTLLIRIMGKNISKKKM